MSASLLVIIGGIVFLAALLSVVYWQTKITKKIKILEDNSNAFSRDAALFRETLQGFGARLVEQEKSLLKLGAGRSKSDQGSESEDLIARLARGQSVESIAAELGLEQAEVGLIKQIYEKAAEQPEA